MSAETTLVVAAGEHDRDICPVSADLAAAGPVRLFDADSGTEVPCQVQTSTDGKSSTLWWLVGSLPRGATRAYRAEPGQPSSNPDCGFGVTFKPGESLDFRIGNRLFTRYHWSANWARPYFHPVVGPGGKRVTRAWPMEEIPGETRDHVHHRGIYVAHGDVNGVDNWGEEEGSGRIAHRQFLKVINGPVWAGALERLDWLAADGRRVMAETRRLAVYNLPDDVRLFDVESAFEPVEGPVTFGDTKEAGLLTVRVATSMDGTKDGLVETGTGALTEKESWGKRAHWCDYSGPVDGERLGIAVLDHIANPRHPTYWHVRDYGLMAANCFAVSAFENDLKKNGSLTIPAGESLTFRYRVYIHRGGAGEARVAARWLDYVYPPSTSAQ